MGNQYPVSNNGAAPLEYGIGGPRIGVKTIALDTATTDKEYEIGGNVLWIADATDLDAKISIKYQEQSNDPIPLQKGSFLAGPSFSRLYISWDAQASKTVTLLYTVERSNRPFRIDNAIANYTGVTVVGTADVDIVAQSLSPLVVQETPNDAVSGYTDVSVAATTTSLLIAAATKRRQVIITSLTTNTAEFRIGSGSTAANIGIPLQPGETLILECNAALYAYNSKASAQTLALCTIGKL